MKAIKGLWMLRSKEDLLAQENSPRSRSASKPEPPTLPPRIRAGTNPDIFDARTRSGSTDPLDEPFQPQPTAIVAPTPSFFSDSVNTAQRPSETRSAPSTPSAPGFREKAPKTPVKDTPKSSGKESPKLSSSKEIPKSPGKENDKRKDKSRDKDRRDKDKGKKSDKSARKDKHGNPVDEDYEKLLDSQKGDFDPDEEPEREVLYVESIKDFNEEIMKKLKKSKIPDEKFEQYIDVLLRVLTFVSKSKKNYRRRCWPEPVHREKPNTIFLAPGKFLIYPEQLDVAREKLCIQEDPKPLIKFGEFEGKGGFGRVFAGKIKNPHNASEKARAAVKVMPHKTDKEIRMNFNEVGLLSFLNHPNIVKFLRCYAYGDELWVLMEFLEGGTLREATGNFQFAETHIAYVAKEMLKGLAYLHQLKIAHRDLKSANVMLSMKAEVKLIDFGLCADFSMQPQATHMCGSPFWMSPEMITQQPHTLATDIWSLAVCLVEMINRKVPHHRSVFKAMFVAASEGFKFAEASKWSPEFQDFISRCLQHNPADRPTAEELLQHPFLRKASTVKQMQAIMPAIFLSNTMTRQGLL